ncbi:hypothetical protein EDB19DRAFT_497174 [Suillus lakei]|nr:hypothetical protein EDB19DRAFT_497174 [Suillus lakei]
MTFPVSTFHNITFLSTLSLATVLLFWRQCYDITDYLSQIRHLSVRRFPCSIPSHKPVMLRHVLCCCSSWEILPGIQVTAPQSLLFALSCSAIVTWIHGLSGQTSEQHRLRSRSVCLVYEVWTALWHWREEARCPLGIRPLYSGC